MSKPGIRGGPATSPPDGFDPGALIDALRARGAERFDPVRFRFIEALARRRADRGAEVARPLDRRLANALAEFRERFDYAEQEAGSALAHGATRFPAAADALRASWEAADFGGLRHLIAGLEARGDRGPLAELLDRIGRQDRESGAGEAADAAGAGLEPAGELKSLRYFRGTWSKLSVDRQLSHAFAQAPENAGPLNSHFLALQSLKLMRNISPGYLEQFLSYVDALLWLDQAEGGKPAQKSAARGERERTKKRKPGRGSAG